MLVFLLLTHISIVILLLFVYLAFMLGCLSCRKTNKLDDLLGFVPSTYLGVLNIKQPADTFIRLDGWYKVRVLTVYIAISSDSDSHTFRCLISHETYF